MRKIQDFKWLAAGLAERPDSRGDRFLGMTAPMTQNLSPRLL